MAEKRLLFADESGIDQTSSHCVVAGYLGSSNQWRKFDKSWRKVLGHYGVPEFHAKDFFPETRRRFVEHYKDWTESECESFLRALFSVINQRDLDPINGSIDVRAFRQLPEEWRRIVMGAVASVRSEFYSDGSASATLTRRTTGAPNHPFFAGFQIVIMEAANATPKGGKIGFIFDTQNVIEGNAVQIFNTVYKAGRVQKFSETKLNKEFASKLEDIEFKDSRDYPGLQASDLYAYTLHRELENTINSSLLVTARNLVLVKNNTLNVLTLASLIRIVNEVLNDMQVAVERVRPLVPQRSDGAGRPIRITLEEPE